MTPPTPGTVDQTDRADRADLAALADGEQIAMRDFSESLPMALLQAREAAMRHFRPLLARHDLTEQQWRVLRALAASPTPLEVGDIVDATFLLAPSLSRILSNLDNRSLILRTPVANDQRRAAISLTLAGHELVASIAPESEAIYNQIESAFGGPALRKLMAQLVKLRDTTNTLSTNAASTNTMPTNPETTNTMSTNPGDDK